MRRKLSALLKLLVCACLAGKTAQSGPAFAAPPSRPATKEGIIFVVDGVGGLDLMGKAAKSALPRAGVPYEIREFDWQHGKGKIIKDLQDAARVAQKAHELATWVRRAKAEDSERPIFFLAKSGGTGIALAAAEELPPATLERIVLLSSALAPTYDVRPALRATKHEIVSFYSPLDRIVLGWGTRQFGTIDRVYGASAGLGGFIVPAQPSAEDQALYARLIQLPWSPRMVWEGNMGGHLGTSMPAFVAKEVAPWFKP
jgi:hypothetical protein